MGSNRIRTMLGLGALAAFGAAELAVVYGVEMYVRRTLDINPAGR